jgi:hypothetical protein
MSTAELVDNGMAIYDGCDFNPNLDLYWDALDITEESALRILPPGSEFTPIQNDSPW